MKNENKETALSFEQACSESKKLLSAKNAKEGIIKFLNLHSEVLYAGKRPLRKIADLEMEYQNVAPSMTRSLDVDRVFPLETVRIEEFRQKHDYEIEEAVVHTGPFADELARSMNALAVTIAADVYFRNSAYKPETEEGRKLLAHEMTHVAQHREGRITRRTTQKELEEEAVQEESLEEYNPDPKVAVKVEKEILHVRKSRLKKICSQVADDVISWLEEQKLWRSEEEYLKLLCAYSGWLEIRG